ncbi:hypothetical protein Nepgr_021637 [Nepenthes gracilis]|uniref:Uncharacterized protein n=1 Tax=Nepenthes gracilis TaxID=150966 RepID=A0AAD3SZD6_NEPGR|nr:hypothetical protein Nepgr_021637 [Nepenthes gracilis]
MNSSAIIGSQELDSMDSLPLEREFPSLQVARKMSYKVKFEDRGPRVSNGISVSHAGISIQHAMPCSSPVSSVSMAISKSDSEMNEVKSAVTVLASSNIAVRESEVALLSEDRIPRQGGLLDVNVQQECHPRVNQLTQQSPPRSVDVVPTSDARPGLSKEHVDSPKGISWSSVVTKNILGVPLVRIQLYLTDYAGCRLDRNPADALQKRANQRGHEKTWLATRNQNQLINSSNSLHLGTIPIATNIMSKKWSGSTKHTSSKASGFRNISTEA